MAKAKGLHSRWASPSPGTIPKGSDYELMEKLEYNRRDFSVNELLDLKNYLLFILHKLKLTNLLIEMNVDIEKELVEEY